MPDNVSDKIRTHNLKGFSTYAKNYFISTYETKVCEIANCYASVDLEPSCLETLLSLEVKGSSEGILYDESW